MTDYSGWTDKKVNEAIFKAKGWVKLEFPAFPKWQRPIRAGEVDEFGKGVTVWYELVPDYTHSWELCGELLEEIGEQVSLECFAGNWILCVDGHEMATSENPKRAGSEGYLKWLAWKEQG